MMIDYFKIRESAKDPVRANPSDAGLDIFWCPEDNSNLIQEIKPLESVVLQTGLKFGVPHGFMLEVKNRSSMAAKKQLVVGACVIDPGYDGEVFVNLHNVGTETQVISPGDKIAQVILFPVIHFKAFEKQEDDLYGYYPIAMSDRKDGALGSTDKKKPEQLNLKYADIYIDFEGEK